jgi:hypothetical protein
LAGILAAPPSSVYEQNNEFSLIGAAPNDRTTKKGAAHPRSDRRADARLAVTSEAVFNSAGEVATVSVDVSGVVALFVANHQSITADRFAATRLAVASEAGLKRAGEVAAVSVDVSSVVALFVPDDQPITADRLAATRLAVTSEAFLDLTNSGATVSVDCVAVVASFACVEGAVSAEFEVVFKQTPCAATVSVDCVAVVALFERFKGDSVAALIRTKAAKISDEEAAGQKRRAT